MFRKVRRTDYTGASCSIKHPQYRYQFLFFDVRNDFFTDSQINEDFGSESAISPQKSCARTSSQRNPLNQFSSSTKIPNNPKELDLDQAVMRLRWLRSNGLIGWWCPSHKTKTNAETKTSDFPSADFLKVFVAKPCQITRNTKCEGRRTVSKTSHFT